MRLFRLGAAILVGLACLTEQQLIAEENARLRQVTDLLEAGDSTVRIVCFGDSITGIYYHTGGRRAWCDMLGIALERVYPKAKLEMINAGASGHTTVQGLARIQRDVIAKKPHLVVVMFGMNDVCGRKDKQFASNLKTIVGRCRESGAAVVLATPNSVYPNDRRPTERLAQYAQIVRNVAGERSVPLADCYRAYEEVRSKDATEWMLLMSETIHPGMNGHRLFAEVMAETISGRRVSLADVAPPNDALRFTFGRLKRRQPVSIVAMQPYDRLVPEVLGELFPGAEFRVTTWPVQEQSLAAIEQWGKGIRKQKPDLVVVAVPAGLQGDDLEAFIRSYNWALNWSIGFGRAGWDLLPILPSVAGPLDAAGQKEEDLARRIIAGMDTKHLERGRDDDRTAKEMLKDWIRKQTKEWSPKTGRKVTVSPSLQY